MPQMPQTAPLYQQATRMLADGIGTGEIPSGTMLTQLGVAERFGISRAPARRALEELTGRNLLERLPSGRFRVMATGATVLTAHDAPAPYQLVTQTGWELLYPGIEMEIVSRCSLGGWRLNEAALARHHGVSRTIAREVVARLHQRGIIRKDDGARWIAPALTARHIDELYELRWLLEPVAMEKALLHLPSGLLDAMRAELVTAMAPDAPGDAAALDHLEHRLHVELLSHCGNDALISAIRLPQSLLIAHHMLYPLTLELFGSEPFLGEHLEIVSRLISGDVEDAKAALVAHLRISRRRAMMRIEAVQDIIQPAPLPYLERLAE